MYKDIKALMDANNCEPELGMAFLEVVNLFAGKWRMVIVSSLQQDLRFTEIRKLIPNITPRMLSKELKELELSGIVKRTMLDSKPVLITYSLTDSAKELRPILGHLVEWGVRHRAKEMGRIKMPTSLI